MTTKLQQAVQWVKSRPKSAAAIWVFALAAIASWNWAPKVLQAQTEPVAEVKQLELLSGNDQDWWAAPSQDRELIGAMGATNNPNASAAAFENCMNQYMRIVRKRNNVAYAFNACSYYFRFRGEAP
jgi:hypothetical protein